MNKKKFYLLINIVFVIAGIVILIDVLIACSKFNGYYLNYVSPEKEIINNIILITKVCIYLSMLIISVVIGKKRVKDYSIKSAVVTIFIDIISTLLPIILIKYICLFLFYIGILH